MLFTKKHYESLARETSEVNDYYIREEIRKFLTNVFEKDNPRFIRSRFLNASISKVNNK